MTMFGIKEAEVATLVRAVAGDTLDRDGILDRFARGSWTMIAEPGDRTAGIVIQSLGSARALDAIVERWAADRWLSELRANEIEPLAESELAQAIERWQPRLKSDVALLSFRQAARYGARLLTPDLDDWPTGLGDLALHAPIALWMRGSDAALRGIVNSIAIVGARAATGYGEHVTMEASAGLVDRGYTIVSGAAYGIDGMAHRAALASKGLTVAFLAGGVDRFYPSGHDALLSRIAVDGAILSELPCGQPPTKWRFLQRNRLIAAASQATIVVEAGWRSGSLNTAGHAAALGRPLGAVPGPVTSATSAGCHRLIRDYDAVLVTNPDEMAELVGGSPASAPGEDSASVVRAVGAGDSAETTRLFDAMSFTAARTSSDIAARAGFSLATVQSMLGRLELEGRANERERGWVKARADA